MSSDVCRKNSGAPAASTVEVGDASQATQGTTNMHDSSTERPPTPTGQSSSLSPPPSNVPDSPRWREPDPAWSSGDVRALNQILTEHYQPITLGTIAHFLGRRDTADVGRWIIRVRQSAQALGRERQQRVGAVHNVPVAHPANGVIAVIGGAKNQEMKLRVYHPIGGLQEVYTISAHEQFKW